MAFTVRLDPEKQQKLDELAHNTDRSRNWVVNEAIDNYLANQQWQIEQIKLSIIDADSGLSVPEERILEIVNKYKPRVS